MPTDFTVRGFGIRVADSYCVVIEKKSGVVGWVEDGQRHPLPLPLEFDSIDAIPSSRVAIAFKAYELVHPGDGLRAALTQRPAPSRARVTPERQLEIKTRIDQRFDQFSFEEAQKVVSGEMTSRLAHAGFSILEQEFAEEYFNEKRDGLRCEMPGEKRLITKADDEVLRTFTLKQPRSPKAE